MLKNKNGKEYKISRPNPLMKYQEIWNNYIIHNFSWDESVERNNKEKLKVKLDKKLDEFKVKLDEKITPELDKIFVEEKKTEKLIEDLKNNQHQKNNQIDCYVLKAENITKKDDLYGDYKSNIKYSEKKLIKIEIIMMNDLYLEFLCEQNLNKNSILFPKNNEKRWWKIINNEKVYKCVPSDFTPSFD